MDLILLEPGDPDLIPATGDEADAGLIAPQWHMDRLKLGRCIKLVSLHQGMLQKIAISTEQDHASAAKTRPIITEMTCVKYVDKNSVTLYEYCLRAQVLGKGKEHPTRLYIARNSGENITNILTLSLRDALISEIQSQSHPNDMPTEQFKLNFTEILCTSSILQGDIETVGKLTHGWSFIHNRAITQFS
ncbi:hypothetical protein D3C72_309200 [compost metagenome]